MMSAKCQKGVCFDIRLLPQDISRGRSVVASPLFDLGFRISDVGLEARKKKSPP